MMFVFKTISFMEPVDQTMWCYLITRKRKMDNNKWSNDDVDISGNCGKLMKQEMRYSTDIILEYNRETV